MVASISGISSSSAAASYYGSDNYYAKEGKQKDPSAWAGKGAAILGLKGKVDIETFEKILEGKLPNGGQIGQKEGETPEQAAERKHRPGVDLTFSPPKDVSLLLLIGGDKRVLKAHKKAVSSALMWTEMNLAGTRIRTPKTDAEKEKDPSPNPAIPTRTGNLVVAKFQHDISRDKDPQLHTHCVIANMTQDKDGKWRALHNDPLFDQRKTISLIYDAQMRQNLRELGFHVTLEDGKSGAYSISGIPEAAKEQFSQRSEAINEIASQLKNPTPAALKKISVKSRPSKTRMTREEKHAKWQARAVPWKDQIVKVSDQSKEVVRESRQEELLDGTAPKAGMQETITKWRQNFFRPTETLRLQAKDPYKLEKGASQKEYAARAAVSFAIRHLEEREAAFSLHNVRRAALEHGADGLTIKDIDRQIRLLRIGNKIAVNVKDPSAEATTQRSINNEKQTQSLVAKAGVTDPIADQLSAEDKMQGIRLTKDQSSALSFILTSPERLLGVQGYAGTGKTTMMRNAATLSEDLAKVKGRKDISILGLAPTHSAVRSLEEGLGHKSQTVQSFMVNQSRGEGPKSLKDTIVVIDESSFLSTKNMNQIVDRLIKLDARKIVLAGDRRQHGAIEAGRPFDIAQRAGMKTAIMRDIVRLRPRSDSPEELSRIKNRKAAVSEAAVGRVANSIKRLASNMHQPEQQLNHNDTQSWMVKRALEEGHAFDPSGKEGVMFIAQGHKIRGLLNNAIREEKIAKGELGKNENVIAVLRTKNMTKTEAMSGRTFDKDDILSFHGANRILNTRSGDTRTVVSVDEKNGLITIANKHGRQKTLPLEKLAGKRDWVPFSVNREERLSLRQNDKLLFTRSHRDSDIAATDAATVKSFDDKTVTLIMNGEDRVFQRDDPALKSLTHGYAITSHAGQGRTDRNVVTVQDGREKMLASQVGFYTDISRSADNLAVITNNSEQLTNQLLRTSGLKSSALDAAKRMSEVTGLDKTDSKVAGLHSAQPQPEDSQNIKTGDQKTVEQEQTQETGQDQGLSL